MLFDNRWNQHTYRSLMLLPFGVWAPASGKHKNAADLTVVSLIVPTGPVSSAFLRFSVSLSSIEEISGFTTEPFALALLQNQVRHSLCTDGEKIINIHI